MLLQRTELDDLAGLMADSKGGYRLLVSCDGCRLLDSLLCLSALHVFRSPALPSFSSSQPALIACLSMPLAFTTCVSVCLSVWVIVCVTTWVIHCLSVCVIHCLMGCSFLGTDANSRVVTAQTTNLSHSHANGLSDLHACTLVSVT